MSPRVLFVDHAGSLGGAELYLLDAARRIPNSTVVTFEDGPFPDRLRADGVDTRVLTAADTVMGVRKQASLLDALRAIPGLVALVIQLARIARDYDVLFLNSQKALLAGAVAGRLAGRPVVWSLHDILTADHFSPINRWVATRWANLLVDRVLVNSEATRDAFVACGGRRENTRLVYNGIDGAAFRSVPDRQREHLRAAWGVGDAPCVGIFSRLSEWKGQHVLLDAIADLDGVHAVIVGDALFPGDEDYAADLREQVDRLNLTGRVHFLGFQENVPALMRSVDVVVHASTAAEPFGRVIVEGQLARRPVIATRAGGAAEIIEDGVNGFLTAPGRADELAAVLHHLLAAPQRLTSVVDRAERTARTRYSTDQMVTGIGAVLTEITGLSSPRPPEMAVAGDTIPG